MQGSQDVQPQADFATWCNYQGGAQDGLHNAVSGVFWWAWNANSGLRAPGPSHAFPKSSLCRDCLFLKLQAIVGNTIAS